MSPKNIKDNARGWTDLMKLVRNGYSWSGSERNRMFLNDGRQTFHEMSHLAGLDHPDDGRGIAVVDWDQDGRLDLWYRNRTAPRLRLMLNQNKTAPPSIAIQLKGTTANRDSIGAIVELRPTETNRRLVRSVRAGDLFLSQSSKWLHFGGAEEITTAEVLWPGGQREKFKGSFKNGTRYLLEQGTGKPISLKARQPPPTPRAKTLTSTRDNGNARIILPSRIPLPTIQFRDQAAGLAKLQANAKPRLLLLWSANCAHCKNILKSFTTAQQSIQTAGIDVLALSVEAISGPAADISPAYDLIDSSNFPFPWGLIDATSSKQLHAFQSALFDRTPASSVPLAILLDQNGNAVAIYRGNFQIPNVIADWKSIQNADEKTLHHLAPPLKGTWFTNPIPRPDLLRFIRAK